MQCQLRVDRPGMHLQICSDSDISFSDIIDVLVSGVNFPQRHNVEGSVETRI